MAEEWLPLRNRCVWHYAGVQLVLEYSLHVVVIERAGVNCGICAFVREELLGDVFLLQLCRLISVLTSRCWRSSGPGGIVDRCIGELSLAAFVYCHDCIWLRVLFVSRYWWTCVDQTCLREMLLRLEWCVDYQPNVWRHWMEVVKSRKSDWRRIEDKWSTSHDHQQRANEIGRWESDEYGRLNRCEGWVMDVEWWPHYEELTFGRRQYDCWGWMSLYLWMVSLAVSDDELPLPWGEAARGMDRLYVPLEMRRSGGLEWSCCLKSE